MTILSSDIKLRESERMTDTSDGGGRRTNRLIADGVAGNIFPKVSRVDSVYGRVNLREVFGHVDTANLDTYAGAHFIITDAPENDRIHVTAFSLAGDYATRTAARDRIESYVIAGPVSRMTLYGRQLMGAQAILAYQRVEEPLPEIGEVHAVSTEVANVTQAQQFFSIQNVAHEVRTFTDASGDFDRRVITLTLGTPLRYEFNGPATPIRATGSSATGVLRTTTVADASRYFGIKPLSVAAAVNDLTVNVPSVYSPLVPSTQREAALSLVTLNGSNYDVQSGAEVTYSDLRLYGGANGIPSTKTWAIGSAMRPGTVRFTGHVPGYPSQGTWHWVDDGLGVFPAGIIDYETGVIAMTRVGGWNGDESYSVTFEPVVAVVQPAHTRSIEITLATRGTVYSIPLVPTPAAGTLIVDYRVMGKWYRLRDDGTGVVAGGSAAYGIGSVDYATGGTVITLGALPDVGSSLILSWGSPAHYDIKTDDANPAATLQATLPSLPVKRGSVVVTYYVGGVAHAATGSLTGAISGDNSVSGTVKHLTGALTLLFGAKLPDAGSIVSVAYAQSIPNTVGETLSVSGSFASLTPTTLDGAPFEAGSLAVTVTMRTTQSGYYGTSSTDRSIALTDDGAGHLLVGNGTPLAPGLLSLLDTIVGTINYATGAIALNTTSVSTNLRQWINGWVVGTGSAVILAGTADYVAITTGVASSDSARTFDVPLTTTPLTVDLLHTTARAAVSGSVVFTLAGQIYFDRNGVVYLNRVTDAFDLSPEVAGSIDYASGKVSLTEWKNNTPVSIAVHACLTAYGSYVSTETQFRTAGSPLRLASLYVQANAEDGELLTGTTDNDGNITGSSMLGLVEQTMGVAAIKFGAIVTAAGHESEPWFDAGNVIGGLIWRPRRVLPGTIRYSAVVLSNLPLNADVLGLDPVRLPSDGRVPIFRPADVGVMHHTGSYNAGTPTAGSTINVGRANLSTLWLEDSARKKLASSLYLADPDAGTVTFAADLSLTGYTPPIAAKHRIEEMVLFSDVQLNGTLSLTAPLTQAFPLGSFVSSALLFGDLVARVTGVFDQTTWTGAWSDTRIGDGATAQYNDIDYPIEVLNNAAVTDRWRIHFTSTTAFQMISENLGVIGTGNTSADCAIVNQLTGQAYFTLRHAGWGAGWSVGNQLRFNTVSASPPIWLARTVLPGATLSGDSFDAQLRGDVD